MRSLGFRLALATLAAAAISTATPAAARDRATVEDFSVHLFLRESRKLSPDIFHIEELAIFNFTVAGKDLKDSKFEGYLIVLRFVAPREVFADGRQAQVVLRTPKGKILRRFSISGVYVGTSKASHHPLFITDLDCEPTEIAVTSHGKRLVKELPFKCGE